MNEWLYVHYEKHPIGRIRSDSSGLMALEYDEKWKGDPDGFPISLSLPLDGSYTLSTSHHFFANLLPEGAVRELICRKLKISVSNDFELLKAIGGDCAGALSITTCESLESPASTDRYEPISDEQLSQWSIGTPDAFSTVTGQNEVRLSLAGAQDKLPVHLRQGQLMLPIGSTPSTHILKFASAHYSHLPENEAFITLLARQIGLPAVDVQIRKTERAMVALIERYDRRLESNRWMRLHQEDFCQALGIHASHKYEKEGGPGWKQCADVLRRHTSFPLVDLQKLLQWSLFNLLVGNADAHGKNLSLIYDGKGSVSLAPFYDLVCTRNYPRIARDMAMNLGGTWDPDQITLKHLHGLANDLGFRPSIVMEQTERLIDLVADSLPISVDQFGKLYGDSPVLERLPIIIRKQLRRLKSTLK